MECRVKSPSKPTANWFKDGTPVVQGSTFAAIFVDEGDQTYLCQLEIRVSSLLLRYPFVSRILCDLCASADAKPPETRRFYCRSGGGCYPWRAPPLSTFGIIIRHSLWLLQGPSAGDAGQYRCNIRNDQGETNANLTLNFEQEPPEKRERKEQLQQEESQLKRERSPARKVADRENTPKKERTPMKEGTPKVDTPKKGLTPQPSPAGSRRSSTKVETSVKTESTKIETSKYESTKTEKMETESLEGEI